MRSIALHIPGGGGRTCKKTSGWCNPEALRIERADRGLELRGLDAVEYTLPERRPLPIFFLRFPRSRALASIANLEVMVMLSLATPEVAKHRHDVSICHWSQLHLIPTRLLRQVVQL